MARLLLAISILALATNSLVSAVGFHGFSFRGLEEPRAIHRDISLFVEEKWIDQPLDHFNHLDNRTWPMRYYENAMFLNKTGPILIMLGGEWEISTGFLEAGTMYEIAATHGAMMYYTEHRYYGKSVPTNDLSVENMQYLNVDQALADVAYFIEAMKTERGLENSKVVVFGGSYSGSMAAWGRLKYPHLIQAALASSAPVFATVDFPEYYEVVSKSLGRYDPQCMTDVQEAFVTVEKLIASEGGAGKIKEYFNLCDELNVKSSSEVAYFMNTLAEIFASVVQYDGVVKDDTKIGITCKKMMAKNLGSAFERLALIFNEEPDCKNMNYDNFVEVMRKEAWNAQPHIMRRWIHQTCTEYGYYQTTSKRSIFGTLFPVEFYTKMCSDLYGDSFTADFVGRRTKRTNILYGGFQPQLTHVIFTNGDVDPYHPLSVLKDLNEFTPAILINGSSHCRDLYPDSDTDVEDLKKARVRVRKLIGEWISS